MSRLDSFIRRMQAQRLLIDHAVRAIADLEGPVLELGLGNGRTFHHLREKLAGRRLIAFDIKVTAQPDSVPAPEDLVLGDIKETARGFAGIGAALVHSDLGSGIPERDRRTLEWLPGIVRRFSRRAASRSRTSSSTTRASCRKPCRKASRNGGIICM